MKQNMTDITNDFLEAIENNPLWFRISGRDRTRKIIRISKNGNAIMMYSFLRLPSLGNGEPTVPGVNKYCVSNDDEEILVTKEVFPADETIVMRDDDYGKFGPPSEIFGGEDTIFLPQGEMLLLPGCINDLPEKIVKEMEMDFKQLELIGIKRKTPI